MQPARALWTTLLLLCALSTRATTARAQTTIRFATIAPQASTWGKVLDVWQRVVKKRTQGALDLRVYYNGIQGDESAMVAKLKTGQLDGAALSAAGLSLIERDVMVLQLPGVTNSWPLSELVRSLLDEPIRDRFSAKGYRLMEWGDIGLVYQMSRGVAVRGPRDLRGRRPLVWRNEPIGPLIYSFIGSVVPVPLGTTEILPALRSHSVDVIAAPALAAEQLQWTPYLDHLTDNVVVAAIGGTVLSNDKLSEIDPDVVRTLAVLQKKTAELHTRRVRKLDVEALGRLKRRMTVVRPSDDDRVEWYRVFLKAVRRMRHGLFSRDLLDRVLSITGKG